MKRAKDIRNLDTIEKEIYRLKLEAKNIEEKLDNNLTFLQENYFSMIMNSFFHRRKHKEDEGKTSFMDSFFKSESFRNAVNTAADHIANRAAEGIEKLVDKIFHNKK